MGVVVFLNQSLVVVWAEMTHRSRNVWRCSNWIPVPENISETFPDSFETLVKVFLCFFQNM